MASEKKARPESLDFLLAAIAPVFIIGMIGSLVYFIIIVCYEGPFTSRLMWILGLYTVAAVLIARIAIEQSRQLAFTYMFALGAATLFVTPQFMTISGPLAIFSLPILIGLLVMVAVLADRITFDCTSMNEQQQSTGVGLLQSLGLVKSERNASSTNAAVKTTTESEGATGSATATIAKKPSQRRHNPGVWVLYFALFALPLFGLGQLVIKSSIDRRWAFTYLFVYLLSSLFLLVLISLLSLRKYLRERGVPMETAFAIRWLAVGMTSVFVVLFLLSMLPIPSYSLLSMDMPFRFTSREDLKANKLGWGKEGVPGEGPQMGKGEEGKEQGEQDQGEDGDNPRQPNDQNQNGQNNGQGKAGDKPNGNGESKSPSKSSSQQGDKEGGKQQGGKQQGEKQSSDKQQGKEDQVDQRQSEAQDGSKREASKSKENDTSKQDNAENEKGEREKDAQPVPKENDPQRAPKREPPQGDKPPPQEQKKGGNQPRPDNAPEPEPPQKNPSMSIQWNFPALVQWLVMLVLLVVALIFGIKYRKELMQAIMDFGDWVSQLFGRKKKLLNPADQLVEGETAIADFYPPFSSFSNPFHSGSGWSREQMVRHLYLAVLSWGYERRVIRSEEETPEEFIRRLARRFPEQQESLSMLGRFYSRIAYARGTISSSEIKPMMELWQWLVAAPKLVQPITKLRSR